MQRISKEDNAESAQGNGSMDLEQALVLGRVLPQLKTFICSRPHWRLDAFQYLCACAGKNTSISRLTQCLPATACVREGEDALRSVPEAFQGMASFEAVKIDNRNSGEPSHETSWLLAILSGLQANENINLNAMTLKNITFTDGGGIPHLCGARQHLRDFGRHQLISLAPIYHKKADGTAAG
jgi:hypothetical protein